MPTVKEFVECVYQLPRNLKPTSFCLRTGAADSTWAILRQSAASHEQLPEISDLYRLMSTHLSLSQRRRWLSSPSFVEALHAISTASPILKRWHQAVATPSLNDVATPDPKGSGYLGVFLLALALQVDPTHNGCFELRTDLLGRIAFPNSDWRIALHSRDNSPDVLSRQRISLRLRTTDVHFCRYDSVKPFLTMARSSLLALLANRNDGVSIKSVDEVEHVSTRIFRLAKLSPTTLYEPAHFPETPDHAEIVGGLIQQILEATQAISPALYAEFCRYINVVRGFELSNLDGNLIGSFSDPTQPGTMNLNVPFLGDDPCLSPFCFTWFGHELAHTKYYLTDTVAFRHGVSFVQNRSDMTAVISRYGRRLPVRTLVQIPYVHLYEWDLLMDAYEAGIHLLPWVNTEDPLEFVAEIRAEIADGFELISKYAELTHVGKAALQQQERLYRNCKRRWGLLRHGVSRTGQWASGN